ncbi:HAMP domain-containing sensor histidine kinase [Mangrovivirga sp. M17]|uniref:histidine kinase n=1 Tax=Mangrovivirga halotolerans TaxID=2993936 RepID=A0ABT3RLF2_9BACT|nr:HAMP domain-containing sensor histidine kinase [Mangrovivirga halotolerans]MCX2742338.1 HAMP domain-containing sensor histidine kinase [Mangrovivirga halotolerans]
MNIKDTLSIQFIKKLMLTFFFLIILMGSIYIFFSFYFTSKLYHETTQKLNANIANHLIEEKFKNESPYLEDGSVNKELFGDIMHDMMAVNRSIEVYLLDKSGAILYSVVLDHSDPDAPTQKVDLQPIKKFIESKGNDYITGDDPRDKNEKKIFSAAEFNVDGHQGYIYIILEGHEQEAVYTSLFTSYFTRMSIGATIITMIFTLLIGFAALYYLTRNIRDITSTVKRFSEGDYNIRIQNAENSDLSVLATNFNAMADTIVRHMEEIKSVDNLRRELIANVSHDLRTPLSIMKGYVETLQIKKESLSDSDKENYLTIIQESSEKLSNLISQLFEYSKLESRQIEPEKEPFGITDLAMDIINKFKLKAESKNIEISIEKTADQLPMVFADISLVERAIQNLIENALKFTPENGQIKLLLSRSDDGVKVTIADSGPGMTEKEQAIVFDRYRQTENHIKQEGAGLGLAIVKKIMELHDTAISINSGPGRGSAFSFNLKSYHQISGT